MLRALVLLLAVANLLFFAWVQGWLGSGGAPSAAPSPPQVRPERLTVLRPGSPPAPPLAASAASVAAAASAEPHSAAPASDGASAAQATPAAAASAPSAASSAAASAASLVAASAAALRPVVPVAAAAASAEPALACLQAGPFDDGQWAAAASALGALLPAGRWTEQRSPRSGRWMVYMGRYGDLAALERKELELRRIPSVRFERINAPPALAPGLSLGQFDNAAAAQNALQRWAQRGVRTARVVTLQSAGTQVQVRVDGLGPASVARLMAQRSGALGKGFTLCPGAD